MPMTTPAFGLGGGLLLSKAVGRCWWARLKGNLEGLNLDAIFYHSVPEGCLHSALTLMTGDTAGLLGVSWVSS